MFCWKCSQKIDFLGKITFRSICEACGASLHACQQCKHYKIGKPNDCNVPGTDFISDKQQANFCEEFEAQLQAVTLPRVSSKEIEKRLFKDEE